MKGIKKGKLAEQSHLIGEDKLPVTTPAPTCVSTPALQNSGITVAGSAMGFLEGKIQTNKQTKGRISVPSAKQNKKNIPLK